MAVVPTVKLNDGNRMPSVGLGTTHPRTFDCDPIAIYALEVGFRHFDTAWVYGNQEPLGDALRKGMAQLGLKREDIFITSKVWNNFHTKENAVKNCQMSLDQLKFDYVDLLLVHWPLGFKEGSLDPLPTDESGKTVYSDVDFLETWEGLEECVKKGMAKSIGVSNFSIQGLKRILEKCTIKPTVNQVERHPYLNRKELLDFCSSQDIILTTYSPLGSPFTQLKSLIGNTPIERNVHLLEDPTMLKIAKTHNKTPAQISLRWAVQNGTVPLPRSSNKERLAQNLAIFDFELSGDEMKEIDGLNINKQAYPTTQFKDHPLYADHCDSMLTSG